MKISQKVLKGYFFDSHCVSDCGILRRRSLESLTSNVYQAYLLSYAFAGY